MRVHTYVAGGGAAQTTDVEAEVRLRELVEIEDGDLLCRVDEDTELDPEDTVGKVFGSGPGHLVVHRCRKITVSVTYSGVEKEVEVRPAARLRRVRAKAVEEFSIDRVDAADLVLRLPGQEQDLDLALPVVSIVAGRSCSATVDLVHAVRPQG